MHNVFNLVQLFERCFFQEFNTRLEGGADEPLYLPTMMDQPARILFTRDYFASALHEVAHWCIAGEARRQLADYGYWYAPDGRNPAEQRAFEKVEVKPQALEWIFSTACGTGFRVSADNLAPGMGASCGFKEAIAAQAQAYCVDLPSRPARFVAALQGFYGVGKVLDPTLYPAERLV